MRDDDANRRPGIAAEAALGWPPESGLPLRDLVNLVLRRKAAIGICVTLGVVLGLLGSASGERAFQSHATVLVDISPTGELTEVLQGARLSKTALDTYIELATADPVVQRVVAAAGTARTPAQVEEALFAEQRPGTLIIEIGARDKNRAVAEQLASEASRAFVGLVDELAVRNGLEPRSAVIDEASSPRPVRPSRDRDVAIGGVIGLIAGAVISLGKESLDVRVRTRHDVAATVGSCIGVVPRRSRHATHELRSYIRIVASRPVRSIAVVSPAGGEGKTTLAIELAEVYATAGTPAIIVDASPGGGLSAATVGSAREGLSGVLRDNADVQACLVPAGPGVWVVPAGPDLGRALHLVGSERMHDALRLLEQRAGIVLVDTAALETTAGTYGLSTMVDGVLLVARAGSTNSEDLAEAASRLRRVGASLIGGVLIGTGGLRGHG